MMIFGQRKKLELELKIQEAKAREAEAKREEARLLNNAEHNRMAMLQKMEEMLVEPVEARKIEAPFIPDGVVPKDKVPAIAMDSSCSSLVYEAANANPQFFPLFEGFPKLSFLMQSSDYYSVVDTTANEMTREWGEFKIVDNDESEEKEIRKDKAQKLNELFRLMGIKDIFNQHIRNELIFGRSQLYIKIKGTEQIDSTPLIVSSKTIEKGSLESITVIEPIWSTPSFYNSTAPTEPDFFVPTNWYILGQDIHTDRLLTFISRPVPDMYKPAYNFSGLSMLQLMQPYVERWQRSVDSAADLLDSFSTSGLKTDLSQVLAGTANSMNDVLTRVVMFNKFKSNRGTMVLDNATEEFFQVNTPLTGVPDLMRHLQEQMGAPSHTPLVKLLGITPSGLNANSDGEIRVYYDYISSLQEKDLMWQIQRISDIAQLHLFGEIDDSIRFVFKPLYQLNAKEQAEKNMTDSATFSNLVQVGAISPSEVRQAVAKDENGMFGFIDAEDVPEPVENFDYGTEEKPQGFTFNTGQ